MKKQTKIICLCVLSAMLCTACGKKNEKAIPFQITSVNINEDTKSAQITASYTNNRDEAKQYNIHDLSFTEVNESSGDKTMGWSGFYNDVNDIIDSDFNVKVWKDIGETPENIKFDGEVSYTKAKTYKVKFKDTPITVMVTPFSVVVQPEKSWYKGNETIVLNAVLKDDSKMFITSLPVKLNSKASEEREEEREYIGGGFISAQVLENDGIKYVTQQKIDINTIEKIEVTSE